MNEDLKPSDIFTFGQFLSVLDPEVGRYRCPHCGKFRKLKDFKKQCTLVRMPNMLITMEPACTKCQAAPPPAGAER